MRSPHLWLGAALVALAAGPAGAAETAMAGGVGSVSAATVNLKGSTDDPAETIEVFHGRFRPYWRGYYHGSSGYSPRPYLPNGPFITSAYYGFRPGLPYRVRAAGVGYAAAPQPAYYACATPAIDSGAPMMSQSETAEPPMARIPGNLSVTPNSGSTAPAPARQPASNLNLVKAPAARKPAYAAYGETDAPRSTNVLVKNPK